MSDQGRWFKLWNTAPGDSHLQALPPEIRWAWAAFGCHTKVHGEHGVVTVRRTDAVLAAEMGVPLDVLFDVILMLPHVHVKCTPDDNGTITVTFLNWSKYQEDSTVYARVKRYRKAQSVTVQEEKRREEKRTPIVPVNGDGFGAFWKLYPRRAAKQAAVKVWEKLRPSGDLRDKILEALAAQVKADYGKREPDKIPHAATWLNGRRWEDEVPICKTCEPPDL